MKEKLLKLNLQYFAEENPDDQTDETNPDTAGDQGEEKTVKLSEMMRRLKQEKEKHDEELRNLKDSISTQISEAVQNAKKEASMTGKELQEYKEKEAQRKLDDAIAEKDRLQKELARRDLKDQAISTLSDKGLPIDEKVLHFVVKDTAEDTLAAIDDMAEIFRIQKEANAQTKPPKTSGGFGVTDKPQSVGNILDSAKITKY